MKHLMIFSVGPVQEFIATARRSRDLWYGSWILSELARVAAKKIVKEHGELIFPIDTEITNIPNKIVAVVETDTPKKFAEDIKTAVCIHLKKELAQKTIDSLPLTEENKKLAYRQIDDLPELYWVYVPYNQEYQVVREQAEALFTARKVTRDFKQMTGTHVPKSSLDGSRESVIDEREYPDNKKDSVDEKVNKVKNLYDIYNARQGERLSGVDLLKRLGARKDEPDFKSTSHMAAIPFLERIVKVKGVGKDKALLAEIRGVLPKDFKDIDKTNEVLVFESRLTDWVSDKTQLADLQKKIKDILDKEEYTDKKFSPSPYYALIRADGDNMGKVIDAQTKEEQHQEFSKALSDFASQVKTIVNENNKGLLIYSGGDDVLAYLPINKALQCAKELEGKFRTKLSRFAFTKDKENIEPTLSIGIVIAHHLDPLSDVLKLAKDAEDKAKDDVEGKNGLAVTLSKRSGIDRTVVGKFSDLHTRLNQMIDLTKQKIISGGTAYELQELYRTLPDDFSVDGLKAEALRIVKHKQSSDGKKLTEEDKANYIKIVDGWLTKILTNEKDPNVYTLNNVANEMIIAKSLADGAESSTGQEEEAQK